LAPGAIDHELEHQHQHHKPIQTLHNKERRATLAERMGALTGLKSRFTSKYQDVARILHEKDEEDDDDDSSTSQAEEFSESSYALSLI
jgi:bifunctional ADP-heptose synthase (sugar kinase/adenylyltransferase)